MTCEVNYKDRVVCSSYERLNNPQFYKDVPSAGADYLVFGGIDTQGRFVKEEKEMLEELEKRGMLMGNRNLNKAKLEKKDEFYTRLEDIDKELSHYKGQLEDKVIYCNCDYVSDTNEDKSSNFWNYFVDNFHDLKLRKVIATYKTWDKYSYVYTYNGENVTKERLSGDGDFRSNECINYLKCADIVITNPPFSLFREYVAQLIEYDKSFLIIGNNNAVSYKDIFPLIMENRLWLGHNANKTMEFRLSKNYEKWTRVDEDGRKFGIGLSISWFTNLDLAKKHEEIYLYRNYYGNEEKYPKYDNYNAIEVSRVKDIPKDYEGVMGVPITFLTKYNPQQFELLGSQRWSKSKELLEVYTGQCISPENDKKTLINGKETYDRLFIRNRKPVLAQEHREEVCCTD